jgi:predicted small metal-binding protein
MAHVLACGDVITGCAAVLTGPTESELLEQVADHAAKDHGITEITPDVLDAVRAAIRTA